MVTGGASTLRFVVDEVHEVPPRGRMHVAGETTGQEAGDRVVDDDIEDMVLDDDVDHVVIVDNTKRGSATMSMYMLPKSKLT